MPKHRDPGLAGKQKKFCHEYIKDFNGTQAAIRAGYSKRSANEQAARMLAKDNISQFVAELQKKASEKALVTAADVINEFKKIGFSNIQDYVGGDNTVKNISEIATDKAAAVSSVKKTVTLFGTPENPGSKEVVEFKLWDKVAALEKLGRHLGIFEKDNEQSRPMTAPAINVKPKK